MSKIDGDGQKNNGLPIHHTLENSLILRKHGYCPKSHILSEKEGLLTLAGKNTVSPVFRAEHMLTYLCWISFCERDFSFSCSLYIRCSMPR